jgi:ParB-like chromosome segregation protein Spo0J
MFMQAKELRSMPSAEVDTSTPAGWRSHKEMWASKQRDNVQDGLGASVAKHGVEYPVTIAHSDEGEPKLDAGHHRIQAAYDADPNSYVPVRHTDHSRRSYSESPQPVTARFPSYP